MKQFTVPVHGAPIMQNGEPVEIAFTPKPKQYLWKESGDTWTVRDQKDTMLHLRFHGLDSARAKGETVSDVEKALVHIHTHNRINLALPLGGHLGGTMEWGGRTILVTEGCSPTKAKIGNWKNLHKWMVHLLGGERQLAHHLGWWQWARKSIFRTNQPPLPGHIPIYIGKSGTGKSFLQKITSQLLGGRQGRPFAYMTGQTSFNADLFESDHLAIDDDFSNSAGNARREFGAKLKELSVAGQQWYHGKFVQAMTLRPKWRVSISMNDEREYRNVLPPMDPSILEKVMLFRCADAPWFPVDLKDDNNWDEWDQMIADELPGLAWTIDNHTIPEDLQLPRYGVKPWHDPELLKEEAEESEEVVFLGCLQHDLPTVMEPGVQFWEGTSLDLERLLTGNEMPSSVRMRKLCSWSKAVGTYLGRLARRYPTAITRRRISGKTKWRIDVEDLVRI